MTAAQSEAGIGLLAPDDTMDVLGSLFPASVGSGLGPGFLGDVPRLSHRPAVLDALFPFAYDALLQLVEAHDFPHPQISLTARGVTSDAPRQRDGHIDRNALLARVADGETLILNQVDRYYGACRRVARALGRQLRRYVNANAYISRRGASGFDTHFDIHNIIVMQLHGEKVWDIFAPSPNVSKFACAAEQRAASQATLEELPVRRLTLKKGDVLYLPRGYPHRASAQAASSIHLTFGLTTLSVAEVLQQLLDRALRQQAPLRSDAIPIGGAVEANAAAIASLASEVFTTAGVGDILRQIEYDLARGWQAQDLSLGEVLRDDLSSGFGDSYHRSKVLT